MEDFIKYLYDNTIKYIISDFNEDEISEIKEGYLNYLNNHYLDTIDEENIEKAKKVFPEVEIKNWKKVSKKAKQSILLKDSALDDMRYYSDYARVYANERLDNNRIVISEKQAKSYIKHMEDMFEKVRDFNKVIAHQLLSESTVDFLYASGISDNMSLRCARYKK